MDYYYSYVQLFLISYTIVISNVHFPPFYYGRLGQNNLGRPSQSTKAGELVLG